MVGMGRLLGEEDGLAVVRVDERRRVERPIPNVSVALAPPKGERLAWAVQKLSELGVAETLLMRTERSIRAWEVGPPGDEEGEGVGRSQRVLSRLRSVAREAAMQSSQAFIMDVRAIAAMDEALVVDGTTVVMLWEAAMMPLRSLLPQQPKAVRLLVGPEGGFSEQEAARAQEGGAAPASLGPNVLRTETAAVVGAALVLARYGRLG
jgi:16S rRNA (uracil1498-N3)-methyltransferase